MQNDLYIFAITARSLEKPLKWLRRLVFYCNENLTIFLTSAQPAIKIFFALILITLFYQYLASSMQ